MTLYVRTSRLRNREDFFNPSPVVIKHDEEYEEESKIAETYFEERADVLTIVGKKPKRIESLFDSNYSENENELE